MRLSVDEIQSRVAAVVDQDEATADISTADYSLRLKYINMAQDEWAHTYDWDTLYTEFNTLTSTSTGNLSIALPLDFRKLASFPQITWDGANTASFSQTDPIDNLQYGSTDKRVSVIGNSFDGYTMRVLGVSVLASGASINVPYYKSIGSLASPVNLITVPNPDFVTQRVVGRIWETREDPRFPQAKSDADRILQNLLEYENVKGVGFNDRVKTVEETRYSARIGDF